MRALGSAGAALVATLLCALPAAAQRRDPTDVELWNDLGLRVKLPERTSLTFTQHLRLDRRLQRLYDVAPEVAVGWGPTKRWRLEAAYRHDYERDDDGEFRHRDRVHANSQWRLKTKPITTSFRVQWQEEVRRWDDDGTPTRHRLRLRLRAKYRKWEFARPYAGGETFQRIDSRDEDVAPATLQNVRLSLGFEKDLGKHELTLKYHFVLPVDDPEEELRHVFGIGLRFDVKPLKKKNDDAK
jgi:hypothetical protein